MKFLDPIAVKHFELLNLIKLTPQEIETAIGSNGHIYCKRDKKSYRIKVDLLEFPIDLLHSQHQIFVEVSLWD